MLVNCRRKCKYLKEYFFIILLFLLFLNYVSICLGQSGLQELVKLSSFFEDFKVTLFAQSSVSFVRAVQDATVNKKLDAEVTKFLLLLCPYFLLSSSHKALEWLIYRYHIHQYNRDQFILMILPYHETRMFVRYVLLK